MYIDIKDLPQLKRVFNIHVKSSSPSILKDIFNMSTVGMDNDLFFKYLYATNKYINNKASAFIQSISKRDCPFQLLHGYSKNGKTTFIQYVRHINNTKEEKDREYRYVIITLNFEKGSDRSYYEKVILFFLQEFDNYDKEKFKLDCLEFLNFLNFYNEFLIEINNETQKNPENINDENSELAILCDTFFKNILDDFGNNLKKINYQVDLDIKKIKGEFLEIVTNYVNNDNCGRLLSLLIIYKIFKYRYRILYGTIIPQRLILLLDNLDDYLNNEDILFFQHPQIELSTFFNTFTKHPIISTVFSETLKKFIEDETLIVEWNFSFKDHLNIVYIFRTANFFVFSNVIRKEIYNVSQSIERLYPKCLLDRKYVRFNSIFFTHNIIQRRLEFFEELVKKLNKYILPNAFYFFKYLSDELNYKMENDDIGEKRSIFSMWNGDNRAIWESIINSWDDLEIDFFKYVGIMNEANKSNSFLFNRFLLKGVFIYLFLYLFEKNPACNKLLTTIFEYRKYQKNNKNIRRFLLNYIINHSEEHVRPESINEIQSKGVGLYDLLKTINNFITKINENSNNLYSFDEVTNFFEYTCSEKIDYFVQLLTIYKSQIIEKDNNLKVNSNYYDLMNELESFNSSVNKEDFKYLNDIRIFNNDSAAFLSSFLMSHFELYSFCVSHDNSIKNLNIKKPLLFAINKINENNKNIDIKNYEFYEIIEKVYENVELCINTMVDFYVKYLIKEYPPNKFITDPLFSIYNRNKKTGNFQFRLHITRHITYLEGFRRGIVEDVIVKISNPLEKEIVNKYLTEKIIEYIKLYEHNYNKIMSQLPNYEDEYDDALITTYIVFKKYKKLANMIIKSEGKDYETVIHVENEDILENIYR